MPTGPTLGKILERVVPGSLLVIHELNTPQGQQRGLSNDRCTGFNDWLKSNLALFFYFNSTNECHMPHDPCHILLFMIGSNMRFNHTNSIINSSGHSRGLFTSANEWASAQWRFLLHIPVTWSPNVNKCWVVRVFIVAGNHWPTTIQHVRAQSDVIGPWQPC